MKLFGFRKNMFLVEDIDPGSHLDTTGPKFCAKRRSECVESFFLRSNGDDGVGQIWGTKQVGNDRAHGSGSSSLVFCTQREGCFCFYFFLQTNECWRNLSKRQVRNDRAHGLRRVFLDNVSNFMAWR